MMEKLYRITPLEKKSVEYFVDVFERLPDGTIRGFDVTEVWRWGQAFREEDEPVWKFEVNKVHCDPQVGWGCELDDLIAVYVNFGDGFTEEEKAWILENSPTLKEICEKTKISMPTVRKLLKELKYSHSKSA